MIPIAIKQEPSNFDTDVRRKGAVFLSRYPNPTSADWKKHRYWAYISCELYTSYDGICAYTGEWFSLTSSTVSVDHFIPKSSVPRLAYEWSNYRLTTQKANNYKGNSIIADPFTIKSGWFVLDLPSCLIKPGDGLSPQDMALVVHTIKILKLNDDDTYVQGRCNIIVDYVNGDISIDFLHRRYPYIAHELCRQNMVQGVKTIFKALISKKSGP